MLPFPVKSFMIAGLLCVSCLGAEKIETSFTLDEGDIIEEMILVSAVTEEVKVSSEVKKEENNSLILESEVDNIVEETELLGEMDFTILNELVNETSKSIVIKQQTDGIKKNLK